MRVPVFLLVVAIGLGCSSPPPTATAVMAREPNHLFWGEATSAEAGTVDTGSERSTDFAIVTATSGGEGITQAAWLQAVETADSEYVACVYTTLVGWKSSSEEGVPPQTLIVEAPPEAAPTESTDVEVVGLPNDRSAGPLRPPNAQRVDTRASLAAWAEENTRTSIYRSFERSEIYATRGSRIRLRFFGGWEFNRKMSNNSGMVRLGYTFGHPMGSELKGNPKDRSPKFMVYAVADPNGAALERIQIVKGSLAPDGSIREEAYDVIGAAAYQIEQMKRKHRRKNPPPATEPGVPALHGFWIDPEFDPSVPSFYVMQAFELPGPGGVPGSSVDSPSAYTAPIWYLPPTGEDSP
ncbi:MAG: DUF3604 domain-containing protein [Myxococcota bacterium]